MVTAVSTQAPTIIGTIKLVGSGLAYAPLQEQQAQNLLQELAESNEQLTGASKTWGERRDTRRSGDTQRGEKMRRREKIGDSGHVSQISMRYG